MEDLCEKHGVKWTSASMNLCFPRTLGEFILHMTSTAQHSSKCNYCLLPCRCTHLGTVVDCLTKNNYDTAPGICII